LPLAGTHHGQDGCVDKEDAGKHHRCLGENIADLRAKQRFSHGGAESQPHALPFGLLKQDYTNQQDGTEYFDHDQDICYDR
jgi:hypothetical protein